MSTGGGSSMGQQYGSTRATATTTTGAIWFRAGWSHRRVKMPVASCCIALSRRKYVAK